VTEGAREPSRGIGRISHRTASWLAWSLWALCVLVIVSGWLVAFLTRHEVASFLGIILYVLPLAFPTIGALVASRRPENPIGWLLCVASLLIASQTLALWYAEYGLFANPGGLPGVQIMAWFSEWIGIPGVLLIAALLFLYFPEGRLLSRRWGLVVWGAVIGSVLAALGDALMSGRLEVHPQVTNPVGVGGAVGGVVPASLVWGVLDTAGIWLLLGCCLAAAFSLVLRYRRAEGEERQQIKWFAYAALVMGIGSLAAFGVYLLVPLEWVNSAGYLVFSLGFSMLPVAVGVAILKYRLYDIDIIINRTLVYGSLTLMLALVYFGSVTVTQALFRTLTGQEQLPQLVVVTSTLVIAALFNPLRLRIRSFIDRSFYRKKYDAGRTLESFASKLRHETDLDALGDDLVGVVRETMQPAHVSLWLRPETAKKGKQPE
jgi:hypothetical protein